VVSRRYGRSEAAELEGVGLPEGEKTATPPRLGEMNMEGKFLDLDELSDHILRLEYPIYEQAYLPMRNVILRKKGRIKEVLEREIREALGKLEEELNKRFATSKHLQEDVREDLKQLIRRFI